MLLASGFDCNERTCRDAQTLFYPGTGWLYSCMVAFGIDMKIAAEQRLPRHVRSFGDQSSRAMWLAIARPSAHSAAWVGKC